MATENEYDIGDQVRVSVVITNEAGAEVDPGVLTIKFKSPLGTVSSFVYGTDTDVVFKTAVGRYNAIFAPDKAGRWTYRWQGTGVNRGAEEGGFVVRNSGFD